MGIMLASHLHRATRSFARSLARTNARTHGETHPNRPRDAMGCRSPNSAIVRFARGEAGGSAEGTLAGSLSRWRAGGVSLTVEERSAHTVLRLVSEALRCTTPGGYPDYSSAEPLIPGSNLSHAMARVGMAATHGRTPLTHRCPECSARPDRPVCSCIGKPTRDLLTHRIYYCMCILGKTTRASGRPRACRLAYVRTHRLYISGVTMGGLPPRKKLWMISLGRWPRLTAADNININKISTMWPERRVTWDTGRL
jgi:hypothetical protein